MPALPPEVDRRPLPLPPRRQDADRVVRLLALAALAGAAAIGLWLTVRSLRWHFYQDALVMHYIAARILAGDVPYRDMLDMNFPVTYLIHTLGLRLFGPSDVGGRAFDLVILAGTVAGLVRALRSWGPWASAFGAVGFWVYHLGLGSLNVGQRDFVMCLPLAWMIAMAIEHERTGRLLALGASAFCLGLVIWMKPTGLLLVPVLLALAWRGGATRRSALASVALGLSLASVGIAAWLASRGGIGPFVQNVWPLVAHYGSLARAPFAALIKGNRYARSLAPWAVLGLLALRQTRQLDARAALLAVAAHSVLHHSAGEGLGVSPYPAALVALAPGAAGPGRPSPVAAPSAAALLVAFACPSSRSPTARPVKTRRARSGAPARAGRRWPSSSHP
jgi:hypothetical protein